MLNYTTIEPNYIRHVYLHLFSLRIVFEVFGMISFRLVLHIKHNQNTRNEVRKNQTRALQTKKMKKKRVIF